MRKSTVLITGFVIVTLLAPTLRAQDDGEKIVDKRSGLVVHLPSDWDREKAREAGPVRFSAKLDLLPNKYVLLQVEVGPGDGFNKESWLKSEAKVLAAALSKVTSAFAEDTTLKAGGRSDVGFSISGVLDGSTSNVRFRGCGVVHQGIVFRILETSIGDAHKGQEKALASIWKGISFQEREVDTSTEGDGADGADSAASTKPTPLEDKFGNVKMTLPAGWSLESALGEDKDTLRFTVMRKNAEGNVLAVMRLFRIEYSRTDIFTQETPGSMLDRYINGGAFDIFYGDRDSSKLATKDMNEGRSITSAEKSGQYELRGLRAEQIAEVRKQEELKRRGDPKAKVPDYKPTVVRGGLAMLSPHIYHFTCGFQSSVGDDGTLIAEWEELLKSVTFISAGAKSPPLIIMGENPGNTFADVAPDVNVKKAAVKDSMLKTERGRKTHKLEVSWKLPPGFKIRKAAGGNGSISVWAQDGENNWATISISHQSIAALGERNAVPQDKKLVTAGWKSNWESKARGVKKMNPKGRKERIGSFRGLGFVLVPGDVGGFDGTFTALLDESSGWRNFVEMETRGDFHIRYKKHLDVFFKSLKFRKKK